jgi:hypothetical protein
MFAAAVVSAAFSGGVRQSKVVLLHDGRDQLSLQNFRGAFAGVAANRWQLAMPQQTEDVVRELWDVLQAREADGQQRDPLLFCIRNLGQFRELRRDEDDFGMSGFGAPKELNAAGRLGDLIRRGPAVGLHLMIWSDTYANAVRWLSSSLMREFDSRIAFRLNQTDSSSLIDTPAAAMLGQGRAILYRDRTGLAIPFRPYCWPAGPWLAQQSGQSGAESGVTSETAELPDINELVIE